MICQISRTDNVSSAAELTGRWSQSILFYKIFNRNQIWKSSLTENSILVLWIFQQVYNILTEVYGAPLWKKNNVYTVSQLFS